MTNDSFNGDATMFFADISYNSDLSTTTVDKYLEMDIASYIAVILLAILRQYYFYPDKFSTFAGG
jgi:hypothetical protein